MWRTGGGRSGPPLGTCFSAAWPPAAHHHPLPRPGRPAGQGLAPNEGAWVPSPCSPAQTTATCGSKHLFFNPQLSERCAWLSLRLSRKSRPQPWWGGGQIPGHSLSHFARWCISAHGSSFCRKDVEGASKPGIGLLQLPVAASAHSGQPPVLTSATVVSSPCGNMAQGQTTGHLHARPGDHCHSPVSAKFRCSQVTPTQAAHQPCNQGLTMSVNFHGESVSFKS